MHSREGSSMDWNSPRSLFDLIDWTRLRASCLQRCAATLRADNEVAAEGQPSAPHRGEWQRRSVPMSYNAAYQSLAEYHRVAARRASQSPHNAHPACPSAREDACWLWATQHRRSGDPWANVNVPSLHHFGLDDISHVATHPFRTVLIIDIALSPNAVDVPWLTVCALVVALEFTWFAQGLPQPINVTSLASRVRLAHPLSAPTPEECSPPPSDSLSLGDGRSVASQGQLPARLASILGRCSPLARSPRSPGPSSVLRWVRDTSPCPLPMFLSHLAYVTPSPPRSLSRRAGLHVRAYRGARLLVDGAAVGGISASCCVHYSWSAERGQKVRISTALHSRERPRWHAHARTRNGVNRGPSGSRHGSPLAARTSRLSSVGF
ncbi:hypothetical protein NUW54_g8382 [Trametes sanguinea]|uniref:Uncharacterized protein n=1 Tax=Trametes sanguinea TaxID=158606 RepID=A0ACC1PDX7_9APHY|nr:hypothetical protein NUW54_g8382 [Trametes sanguinea]